MGMRSASKQLPCLPSCPSGGHSPTYYPPNPLCEQREKAQHADWETDDEGEAGQAAGRPAKMEAGVEAVSMMVAAI